MNKLLRYALFISLWFGFYGIAQAQNCTINAGTPTTICPGEPFELTATITSAAGATNPPTWSQVGGPAVTITPHTATTVGNVVTVKATITNYIPGGVYTFRASGQCVDGSAVKQEVTYTVSDLTVANAGTNQAVCPGTFVLQGSPLKGGENGRWVKISGDSGMPDPTNPNSANATLNLQPTANPISATYRYTITNTTNCSSFADVTITNLGAANVVTAGTNQNLSCYNVTNSTQLSGSFAGAYPATGQLGTWTFVSGPSTPTINDIHKHNTVVSNLIEGTYKFRWTVTGTCHPGSADVDIVVGPPNQTITNAGGRTDIFCDGRTSVLLKGPAPMYANETVKWTRVGGNGPGGFTIVNDISNVTMVTGLDATAGNTYVFEYFIKNTQTGCESKGNYTISFAKPPTITVQSANPYFAACGENFAAVNYTVDGGTTTQFALVSAPAGSTLQTALGGLNNFVTAFDSGTEINGFDKTGTYILRYRRSTNNNVGGCSDAYVDVKIVISSNSATSNAGTMQVLACNITQATLNGNEPTVGVGRWSQVAGPNTANIVDPTDKFTQVTGLISGQYTFRWLITGGDGSCVNSQSDVNVQVSVPSTTTAAAGTSKTVCFGNPVTLEGNTPWANETGTWTVTKNGNPAPEVIFSNVNDPKATVTGLAAGTDYTFRWTVSSTCSNSYGEVTITTANDAAPTQANAGIDQCYPSGTTTFALAGNASVGVETGTWTLVSGPAGYSFNDEHSATTNVTITQDGNYVFRWSISNGGGCAATADEVAVTVGAPELASVGAAQANCVGDIVLSGNTPVIGTGTWTQIEGPGGAVIADIHNPTSTVTGLAAGRYKFRWTITGGACGGSSFADLTVNLSNPPDVAIAGADIDVCNSTTATLGATPVTHGTGRWSVISGPNVPTFANISDAHSTLSNLVYGTYKLRWITSDGLFCPENTSDVTITVRQGANAGTNQNVCNVTSVDLNGNNNSVGTWTATSWPGVPAVTYQPTITPNGANGAIASGLTSGTYVFTYTITDNGSCSPQSANVTYVISAPPTIADAGPDQQACSPVLQTFTLAANTPVVGTGKWSIETGSAGTGTFSPNDTSPNATFTPDVEGVFLLKWQITNANCVGSTSSSDYVRISMYYPPSDAVVEADKTISCVNATTLTATAPAIGFGTWTLVSGPNTPTIEYPNSATTAVTGLTAGVYEFKWTVTNGTCAAKEATVKVTVNNIPPVTANAGDDQTVCFNAGTASVTLNGNAPDTGAGETGLWTMVSGPGTATFATASQRNTSVSFDAAGTYILRWTTTNAAATCTSGDDVTVSVLPTGVITTANNSEFCWYTAVGLDADALDPDFTGTWSVSEKPSGAPDPVFSAVNGSHTEVYGLVAGTYKFKWTVSKGAVTCAANAAEVTIIIKPLLTPAYAGSAKTTCYNVDVALTADPVQPGETGTWTVSGLPAGADGTSYTFSNPNSPTSNFKATVAGEYTLDWTTSNGTCSTSSSTKVTVQPALYGNVIAVSLTKQCSGNQVTFTVPTAASGGTGSYTYQWQRRTDGGAWSNLSTNATLGAQTLTNTGNADKTYEYRRIVYSGNCAELVSNVVSVLVRPTIKNNTISTPATSACFEGSPGVLTGGAPTGGDGSYTYQWQVSVNSGAYSNVTANGAYTGTQATYEPASITNNGNFDNVYSYRRIVYSDGCSNTSAAVTFTIYPRPTLTSASATTTCSNTLFSYTPLSNVIGAVATYTWTRAAVTGIDDGVTTVTRNGAISETLVNTTNAPIVVRYVFTVSANGCTNPTTFPVDVTVNPTPVGTDATVTSLTCGNGNFSYNLQNNVNATTAISSTFSWTVAANNVTGASAGSGTSINQTLINTSNVVQQVVYTITPKSTLAGACDGKPFTLTVTVPVCEGVTITKTTSTTTVSAAGDIIPYIIVVSNTGNAAQHNVVVNDPFLGGVLTNPTKTGGNQDNVLDKGETWTYTGNYTVTQADIDNYGKPAINTGKISNVATLTTDEHPVPQTSGTDVNIVATSSYAVAKTSTVTQITHTGQIVPYTITVTNTGNTAIGNLVVTDPLLTNIILTGGDTNGNAKLDKGEIWTYSGTYTVKQSDLDNNGNKLPTPDGNFKNTVSVSGKKPNGDPMGPITAEKEIPLSVTKSFTVKKESPTTAITHAGQVVPYTITIANTGTVAISNIIVTDPLFTAPITYADNLYSGDINGDQKLDVNETWTYTGSYTVTQADIDNNGNNITHLGELFNEAKVKGTYPDGVEEEKTTNQKLIPITPYIAYKIEKTSTTTAITAAGQAVSYQIKVTNIGDGAISNLAVTDPMLPGLAYQSGDTNTNNKLDVGEIWAYAGNYTVTQANIDNHGNGTVGILSNTATVNGNKPDGTPLAPATATVLIPLQTTTAFAVAKTSTTTQITQAGQIVPYTITVTNTGVTAISNVVVTDPMLGGIMTRSSTPPTYGGDANNNGKLDLNETWTYTGTYTVTQADIDNQGNLHANGKLTNTVNVTGEKPDGSNAGSANAKSEIPIDPAASFVLAKTSDVAGVNKAGDLITYTVTATNNGQVAIENLLVTDPMVNLSYQSGDTNTNGKLEVGETWTYRGTYTVTQADIDNNGNGTAGKLVNTVSANGRKPDGSLIPTETTSNEVTVAPTSNFSIVKATTTTAISKAGQVIPYTIRVNNTGTVAVSNVVVNDPLISASPLVLSYGDVNNNAKLDVNETWVYETGYTVTQADIDNHGNGINPGMLTNTATVDGQTPQGSILVKTSNVVNTPVSPVVAYSIEKTANATAVTHAGQQITYTITVKNTGYVAISNVVVTDPLLSGASLIANAVDANGKLDVGETWTYTATYTVLQSDIDNNGNGTAGVLSNTATVNGDKPDGTSLPALSDTKVIPLNTSTLFTVNKTADKANVNQAGDVITYTIAVENTGLTAITSVVVNDPLTGGVIAAPTAGDTNTNNILDIGETWIYKPTYTVTQADIDRNGNSLSGGQTTANGNILNLVTVTGNKPDGSSTGTVTAENSVPIVPTPSFSLTKTSNVTAVTKAGDLITYTVTVANTGTVALNTITVTDPMLTNLTLTGGDTNTNGKLDVNETWTYTGSYKVTQADIDQDGYPMPTSGKLVNVVSANGRMPDGSPVYATDITATHNVDITPTPGMTIIKATTTTAVTKAGQLVSYTITVANTGTVAISNVQVTDPLLGGNVTTLYSGDVNGNNKLDVNETWTYTGTYTVKQSDIDQFGYPTANSGLLVNTAAAAGVLPDNSPINGTSNTISIPITLIDAAYSIAKNSATAQITAAGEIVPYTITVKNIGSSAISNVVVNDPLLGGNVTTYTGDTNSDGILDVNETWTYTRTYTVLQSDIDNNGNTALKGVLSNTATLTGNKPDGTALVPATVNKVIPLNTSTLFSVTKTANVSSVNKVGDIINYEIKVKNDGVTAIANVAVNDPLTGGIIAAPTSGDTNNNNMLDIGETWIYTAAYIITQADIDRNGNSLSGGQTTANGNILNLVTVTGDKPDGSSAGTVTAENNVPIVPTPSFALAKTSDIIAVTKAGDVITYTVTVANTGTVALNTITITDPMLTSLTLTGGDTNTNGKLEVGETWIYKGTYTVSQADIDNNSNGVTAGKLVNVVSANGRKPDGSPVYATDITATHNVDLMPNAAMTVKKATSTKFITHAGQVVEYAITVANTGTVAISNVQVTDPLLGGNVSTLYSGDVNNNGIMDVLETWTFVGSYTVKQSDIDQFGYPNVNSGLLENTAAAAGLLPDNSPITGTSNPVNIPITLTDAAYSIAKNSATAQITVAGQIVPYTITVKNIGSSAIKNVAVTDPMLTNLAYSTGDTNSNGILDVNETWTYNGTYTVQQSDIDNNGNTPLKGVLSNTATLSGNRVNGTALAAITATKVIPLNTSTLFTVTKIADRPNVTKAGDIINYEIKVANTGVTAITHVVVNDPLLGGILTLPSTPPAYGGDADNNGVLDIGETWVYLGSYTVTQADMDRNGNAMANNNVYANGSIINIVNVSGEKPDGSSAGRVTATNIVPIQPAATLTLVKTADRLNVTKAGDVITYTIKVGNTGTAAMNTVMVADPMVNLVYVSGDANNNGKLELNEEWTYTGKYTVTQADIDNNGNGIIAGKLVNTASVQGRLPNGALSPVVTATANVNVAMATAMTINKNTTTTQITKAGQLVPYTITIANTGTQAISNVVVTDPLLSNLAYGNGDINTNGKLDVNETWTYTGNYIITQQDIDQIKTAPVPFQFRNIASVMGENPDGSSAGTFTSTKDVPVLQTMSVDFQKVVTGEVGFIAGQLVKYEIKVINTGNTTLNNITVTDPNATITSGSPIAQLSPGQTVLVLAQHVLTQADVDAGKVINQAELSGFDPNGDPVVKKSDDPSTADPDDPTVVQIVSPGSISLVKTGVLSGDGNTVTYSFTVKNPGIVTLSNVTISDPKFANPIAVTPSVMPPNSTGTATAVYTITDIEKKAGQVSNTAIVTGVMPNGFKVNDISGTNENNNEVTLVVLPNITASKAVADANANGIIEAGEELTYTITINNNGDYARTGVAVTDPLPTHTNYVNGSASNGGNISGGTISWSNLTIPAKGSLSVTFKATVDATLPLGLMQIENIASVINPANPAEPVTVKAGLPTEGKLESSKLVNDNKGNKDGIAQANETITYGILVKNEGGSLLTGVKVKDVLPAGVTYVAGSASDAGVYTAAGNQLDWTINIAAGASVTLTFDAKVVADVNGISKITNMADITGPTGQHLQPSVDINVDPSANLAITKELLTPAPVKTGDYVTYRITVQNLGQNKATGVTVTDQLPASLDVPLDIQLDKGTTSYNVANKTLTWLVGDMALNEQKTSTFKARIVAAGSLVNSATVSGDQPDDELGNNKAASGGHYIDGPELLIPNLFTPNGDGNNDTFEILGLNQYANNELVIVNRWGNELFRTKNYQNNWTGEGLNEGTYYYLLRVQKTNSSEWQTFKGYITLIRAFKK